MVYFEDIIQWEILVHKEFSDFLDLPPMMKGP